MPVKIFFCYAHEDELLLNKLESHLRPLQRQGLIDVWYDRDISAGTEWGDQDFRTLNAMGGNSASQSAKRNTTHGSRPV